MLVGIFQIHTGLHNFPHYLYATSRNVKLGIYKSFVLFLKIITQHKKTH